MEKIIRVILYILIVGTIIIYRDTLVDKITYLFDSTHAVTLDSPNEYFKNLDYKYVKQSIDFIPYSKQDLLNIYYSVLDRGYETFTFYCPKEYVSCIEDVGYISNPDSNELESINYFISPFNTEKSILTSYSEDGEVTLKMQRLYTDEEIRMVNDKIDEIMNDILSDDMGIEDKILAIHDYIINNTKYDEDALLDKSKYKSYSSYGALIEGYATCNGYADAMALFLDRLGVLNYRVISDTHVWNAVYINNQWLHLDLTWDDPIDSKSNTDSINHKFYLIDTETLEGYNITDHEFNKSIYLEVS